MPSRLPVALATSLCLGLVLAMGHPLTASAQMDEPTSSQNEDALLWSITFTNSSHLNRLAATLDVWEVDHANRTALAMLTAPHADELSASGEILEPAERRPQGPEFGHAAGDAVSDAIPGFPCYRTVDKLENDLQSLAARRPELAAWSDIGNSWDKVNAAPPEGHDLFSLTVTNRNSGVEKFTLLVVAAIHARELVTAEIAARFAEYLIDQYGVDPDVTWLLDYGEVHIIPLANPDGRVFAEQLYYWRKNTDSADGCEVPWPGGASYGVDLNRNSSVRWNGCVSEGCSSSNSCSATFRGRAPASEPETRTLQAYGSTIFPDQRDPRVAPSAPITTTGLLLSLHSYGELVMFPWGWSGAPSPNDAGLRALGARLAEPLGYTSCQAGEPGCLYQTDGSLEDWAYGKLGIGAYTMEFGAEFFQQCPYFENVILEPAIESLMLGFKYSRLPYALTAAPQLSQVEVSDKRIVQGFPLTLTVTLDVAGAQTGESVGFQYSLDSPSWAKDSSDVVQVLSASKNDQYTSRVTHTLDTSTWELGRHLLFVEGIDSAGHAGVPIATGVDVVSTHTYYLPFVNGYTQARPH